MNDTGFPSPFIDIMMLRPASRTAAMSAWNAGIARAHHRAGIAEIAHQLFELVQLRRERRVVVAVELDDQQRVRLADQHPVDGGAEDRNAAAEVDHGAIDQFHRLGVELHDVLRRLHRAAEGRELADAQHLARLDRMQRQFDRGGEGERALRSHQQPRQVLLAGERARPASARRCCSRRRGEAARESARRSPRPPPRPSARSRWISSAMPRGTSAPILSGSRPNLCCVPSARMASIARTLSAISP